MDTRTLPTDLGPMAVTEVQMQQLEVGDLVVSEATARGHLVYRVTADCFSNRHGWLYVERLGEIGANEDREGFFSYPVTHSMNYVVSGGER
ncbi:hypothetical protein ABGB07_44895 [Micromonosporaceae bacterium B7E4]